MAVAFRANGTFVDANSTTTGAIALPAGLTTGDILLLPIQARGTAGTVATPSGYTKAAEVNITASHRLVVFYKYVTNAGTEAAPTVTQTVSGAIRGRLTALSGGNATTQLDVSAVTAKHADLAAVTAPSITPITPAPMVIWIFSSGDDNTLNANTQGTLAYSSDGTAGTDGSIALVYEVQGASIAASGTCTMTESVNGPDNWNCVTLAIRPAAVADTNPSTALFDDIYLDVDLAFGASPLTPSPAWTRVTADMLEAPITIQVGHDSEFSESSAGTMEGLTLANPTRTYDPEYTAGIYYGQLNPNTAVRIWCRYASVNYPLFAGYVKSWPQSYIGDLYSWVTLNAVDLFALLSRQQVPETALMLAVLADGPSAYWTMHDEFIAPDLSRNGRDSSVLGGIRDTFITGESGQNVQYAVASRPITDEQLLFQAGGDPIDQIRSAEFWFLIESHAVVPSAGAADTDLFQVEFFSTDCHLRFTTESTPESVFMRVTVEDGLGGTDREIIPVAVGVPYHFAATVDSIGTTLRTYVNGEAYAQRDISALTFTGGSLLTKAADVIISGETLAVYYGHLATYEETLTSTQIQEHYQAGISGGLLQTAEERMTDFANFAGIDHAGLYDGSLLGADTYMGTAEYSGTVLEEMQATMKAEQGRLYVNGEGVLVAQGRAIDWGKTPTYNSVSQATFGDDPTTELPYETFELEPASADLVRNVIEVSIGDATVAIEDAVSVTQYGPQDDSVQTSLSSVVDALNLGRARLRRYSQPTARVASMTVNLRDPRLMAMGGVPLMLAMQPGWRVTVNRHPQDIGVKIEQEMTVEGFTRKIGDGEFTMTLYLVPALPAYTEQPWFIVGDTTYGRVGASADNRVPR